MICELKRANAAIMSHQPGAIDRAGQSLTHQQQLAAQIPHPSTELRAWLALTQAAIASAGPHPEQALPILDQAAHLGELQGLDSSTELAVRSRLTQTYLRMGDGANAERAARAYLESVNKLQAGDAASLGAQMNLAQALFAQGKNQEAVAQIDQSYPEYVRLLGPSSLYTLQALSTRAAAEGNLKNFPAAIRDDLMVHDQAQANPSAGMFVVIGLVDAASSECRIQHVPAGIAHAREALERTRSKAGTEPALVGSSAFALAECLLSQQESAGAAHGRSSLVEVEHLLASIDVASVAHLSANPAFPGFVDVARARLALAEKNYPLARQMAATADPYFRNADADENEKASLLKVESATARSGG
jgi:tetratricopeptide (TPR) repeat protein